MLHVHAESLELCRNFEQPKRVGEFPGKLLEASFFDLRLPWGPCRVINCTFVLPSALARVSVDFRHFKIMLPNVQY